LCRAQGANVNLKGDEGKTALFHACRRGKTAIVGVLLENGAQANAVDEEMKTVRLSIRVRNTKRVRES
jgi:ankyrin repeat protein